ncbi:hypothetical protein QQS21_003852 [Conoideocrella luteorostrata]|uniref:Ubiquitin-protein ligase n=1 Tax=Conoideocrella luteorostrata TaxID=1105319 RepID=A0AAJ0CV94_9HYPO|nr:hypothetical protein QQS21_003852 [Conoideocrella luteorostrata]
MDAQHKLVPGPAHTAQPFANLQTAAAASWHNITAWAFNVTRHAPILEDIISAGPRIFTKLGSYMALPDTIGSPAQLTSSTSRTYSSAAPEPNIYNLLEPNDGVPNAARIVAQDGEADPVAQAARLSLDGARGLGSVFSYATSKWAISCVAMALILNRTHIFAATRRRLRFRWHVRLLLRLLPLLLLAFQSVNLLRSIQCQTSPDFNQLRWGGLDKASDLTFVHHNTFLNKLSAILLFGATDRQSCELVGMVPQLSEPDGKQLRGSLSILWPLFGVLCLSQFVETLSRAVQGRPLSAETGMTLFEQSLAFAEADAAINNQLGLAAFPKHQQSFDFTGTNVAASIPITRSLVLRRVNTPPEVLFIAFLSSMTHLSSHVLGIFDAQSRYRLVNTSFWGFCFMGTIVWSAFEFELGNPSAQSLLRFPTVCIIGFVPHVLVLSGIAVCLLIYGLALILSALSPPPSTSPSSTNTIRQRLAHAHSNMQANVSLAEIRITREMDFYTAILRIGFAAITMASEAVYLNEERGVNIQQYTWLEEARFREVEELQRQVVGIGLLNSHYDEIGTIGLVPVKEGTTLAASGYSRERAGQRICRSRGDRAIRAGTGATERSSRWLMAVEFLLSITRLIARIGALAALWVLCRIRIRTQPAWLLWLARRQKFGPGDRIPRRKVDDGASRQTPNFQGERLIPHMEGIDVEAEFRRLNANQDENSLDADLYKYWVSGGWWGSNDMSGDYNPEEVDNTWDTTSVISTSSRALDDDMDNEWELGDNEQKTPTRVPAAWSPETNPMIDTVLDTNDLARLLHPATVEEREEAHTLSAHLLVDGIMTRSAFRRRDQFRRSRVLLRSVSIGDNVDISDISNKRNTRLGCRDEEQLLEQILLSRRNLPGLSPPKAASNLGHSLRMEDSQSLPCVVCHSSVRTIIVWPCRCLSLCDDCRVSLAMNNFDKCVCCRRDVMSFSRIFVP